MDAPPIDTPSEVTTVLADLDLRGYRIANERVIENRGFFIHLKRRGLRPPRAVVITLDRDELEFNIHLWGSWSAGRESRAALAALRGSPLAQTGSGGEALLALVDAISARPVEAMKLQRSIASLDREYTRRVGRR